MPADLHLDPDGLRRAARAALRIADGLDAADPGPPGAPGPQEDLRESLCRVREELYRLAAEAGAAADRAEEADRTAASLLRGTDADRGTGRAAASPFRGTAPDRPR